jgi:hypothetical protein
MRGKEGKEFDMMQACDMYSVSACILLGMALCTCINMYTEDEYHLHSCDSLNL